MDPSHPHAEVVNAMNQADPFETGKITYSQCVKVLSPLLAELAMRQDADDEGFDFGEDGHTPGMFAAQFCSFCAPGLTLCGPCRHCSHNGG